jgi:hypothetical protein
MRSFSLICSYEADPGTRTSLNIRMQGLNPSRNPDRKAFRTTRPGVNLLLLRRLKLQHVLIHQDPRRPR